MVEQEETKPQMTLYGYWRSGASWRVRFVLGLKGFDMESEIKYIPVHLVKEGGQQHKEEYVSKFHPMHVSLPSIM